MKLLQLAIVEERKMLKAKMDQKLAEIDEVNAQLREATIRSPARAIIDILPVRKGDVLTPNQTVARILKVDDLWVKIFIPETEMGKIRLDQAVEVTVDSYPGRRFKGKIYYIASQSEFTPATCSRSTSAGTRSSRIKVRVDRPCRRRHSQVGHGCDGVCAARTQNHPTSPHLRAWDRTVESRLC